MTLKELLSREDSFRYQMLDRMKRDCLYYLGDGGRQVKHLWALDEAEHIHNMKELWNSFEEKPEWLSMEEIEEFGKEMLENV